MAQSSGPGLTPLGKAIIFFVVVGLIGAGAWLYLKKNGATPAAGGGANSTVNAPGALGVTPTDVSKGNAIDASAELVPMQTATEQLPAPVAYVPKNNTIDIELSTYAGYAGLVAANGGLAASENSVFFKKHGFKVNLTLSEDESWPALNSGKMAASATTADVLAAYGKQFNVVVPAQIGYSRGADGIVVRREIRKINDLKGKVLACCQFTESDFFIRYLAQQAGLDVNMLADLNAAPDAGKVNLVFTKDGFTAGDLLLKDVKAGGNHLAGAVTWDPKTSEVAANSDGKLYVVTTNKNLLIVADILVVNRGFAQQNPKIVEGLVDGLMAGNAMVREHQETYLPVIGAVFKWSPEEARAQLAKVHLANVPENEAFFNGSIAMAGSFGGIYQSAVLAYGSTLIPDPVDSDHFADLTALRAIEAGGEYNGQQIAIAPIASSKAAGLETDPLLSKDIRFKFEPNSATLDQSQPENLSMLAEIKKLVQVSPGSRLLLRGHVDNGLVARFRTDGGEELVQKMALEAMDLSKRRSQEIKRLLVEKEGIDAARIETVGRGWQEPVSTNSDENRRVEVQWFTLE